MALIHHILLQNCARIPLLHGLGPLFGGELPKKLSVKLGVEWYRINFEGEVYVVAAVIFLEHHLIFLFRLVIFSVGPGLDTSEFLRGAVEACSEGVLHELRVVLVIIEGLGGEVLGGVRFLIPGFLNIIDPH